MPPLSVLISDEVYTCIPFSFNTKHVVWRKTLSFSLPLPPSFPPTGTKPAKVQYYSTRDSSYICTCITDNTIVIIDYIIVKENLHVYSSDLSGNTRVQSVNFMDSLFWFLFSWTVSCERSSGEELLYKEIHTPVFHTEFKTSRWRTWCHWSGEII